MLKMKAYIDCRAKPSVKSVTIHHEICEIYAENQDKMTCRSVAFRSGQQKL